MIMADKNNNEKKEDKVDKAMIDCYIQSIATLNSRVKNLDNLVMQMKAERDIYKDVLMEVIDKLLEASRC